jgi:glyoxylase-like metal-dependent hydrolase (beta-lactamase superfamily II)
MVSEHLPLKTCTVLAFGLLAFLSACGGGDVTETPSEASLDPPPLKLRVFDCGYIPVHDLELFSLSIEEVAVPELFVPCYLVEHSGGRLIWDAGVPAIVADSPDGMETYGFFAKLDRPLADQLAELGIGSSDVDFIAFSHMHWDHVGQANQFAEATLLIQRAEHEAAFVDKPTVQFFERELYAKLEDNETVLLDGDHDIFGDGRVVIKSAPGHTPGHQVLFLELEATGPIVLSGDLYHFPESRRLRRVPRFNFDREQTLASMDRIEAFLEEKGAHLWIGHDFASAQGLRKSPEFYE